MAKMRVQITNASGIAKGDPRKIRLPNYSATFPTEYGVTHSLRDAIDRYRESLYQSGREIVQMTVRVEGVDD